MDTDQDQQAFAATVHSLFDPNTLIINCPNYTISFEEMKSFHKKMTPSRAFDRESLSKQNISFGKDYQSPEDDLRLFKDKTINPRRFYKLHQKIFSWFHFYTFEVSLIVIAIK